MGIAVFSHHFFPFKSLKQITFSDPKYYLPSIFGYRSLIISFFCDSTMVIKHDITTLTTYFASVNDNFVREEDFLCSLSFLKWTALGKSFKCFKSVPPFYHKAETHLACVFKKILTSTENSSWSHACNIGALLPTAAHILSTSGQITSASAPRIVTSHF